MPKTLTLNLVLILLLLKTAILPMYIAKFVNSDSGKKGVTISTYIEQIIITGGKKTTITSKFEINGSSRRQKTKKKQ